MLSFVEATLGTPNRYVRAPLRLKREIELCRCSKADVDNLKIMHSGLRTGER